MEQQVGDAPSAPPRTSGIAIAALVCGIGAFVIPPAGFILAILGIVFGVKGKSAIDVSRGALTGRGMAVAGMTCGIVSLVLVFAILPLIAIPNFLSMRTRAKEASLKSNMHTLQLAAEDFSTMAEGAYPATINATVGQVVQELGYTPPVSAPTVTLSLVGTGTSDPVTGGEISASEDGLLPSGLRNPMDSARPAVGTWNEGGKPQWSRDTVGMVWYVPVDAKGHSAKGYEIYGVGAKDILTLVLTSGP